MLPNKKEREQVPFEEVEREKIPFEVGEDKKQERRCESLPKEEKETTVEDNHKHDVKDDMGKSRADILIEKSKINYSAVIKLICNMYDGIFSKDPNFAYGRKDLLNDYDSYLQAILIKLCYINDKFTFDTMKFVENVADYGKLVDGVDFTLFANCAKEMKDVIFEKAEERLKEVPVCFKLAGAVDKSKNLGVMKTMLDSTVKIAFNLKFIDEQADLKDNSDVVNSLKSIYVFAKANGINVK